MSPPDPRAIGVVAAFRIGDLFRGPGPLSLRSVGGLGPYEASLWERVLGEIREFLISRAIRSCKLRASRTADALIEGAFCAVSRTRSLERLSAGKYVSYSTARVFSAGKHVPYATEPLRFARSVPMNATKRVFSAGKYVLNSTAPNVFPGKYTPYCTTGSG